MKVTTKGMVYIALFTSIMIVCAFITIPFAIPFTLQTFALFTIIGILGTKRAFISVLLYLLLGAVGLPVFSGFRGGIGHLFGATGGYLLGFLLTTLISGFLLKFFSKKRKSNMLSHCFSMLIGLLACYGFGTIWYLLLYTNSTENISFVSVLSLCVFPFVLPDILKIILSAYVTKLLKKRL